MDTFKRASCWTHVVSTAMEVLEGSLSSIRPTMAVARRRLVFTAAVELEGPLSSSGPTVGETLEAAVKWVKGEFLIILTLNRKNYIA